MNLFTIIDGKKLFLHGKDNIKLAEEAAENCSLYSDDDDEEIFYESSKTCYNCRFRRWNEEGFQCMKG